MFTQGLELIIVTTVKLQLDLFSNNFDKWKPIKLFLYKERLLIDKKEEGRVAVASVSPSTPAGNWRHLNIVRTR